MLLCEEAVLLYLYGYGNPVVRLIYKSQPLIRGGPLSTDCHGVGSLFVAGAVGWGWRLAGFLLVICVVYILFRFRILRSKQIEGCSERSEEDGIPDASIWHTVPE